MPIHAVLPLARVAEAHAMLEHSDDLVGRIVLHPWASTRPDFAKAHGTYG
jgi:hypothetical protein